MGRRSLVTNTSPALPCFHCCIRSAKRLSIAINGPPSVIQSLSA
ncbi:unnamed protein product [Rodentolepis nana]|uniref:Uncharacterized protein n=1 Tax=Rodentolepis nana TaxID=102285 RepID=A0A0R3TY74_RODNA|nr:unnamed protein product [Rodentolepis nana]